MFAPRRPPARASFRRGTGSRRAARRARSPGSGLCSPVSTRAAPGGIVERVVVPLEHVHALPPAEPLVGRAIGRCSTSSQPISVTGARGDGAAERARHHLAPEAVADQRNLRVDGAAGPARQADRAPRRLVVRAHRPAHHADARERGGVVGHGLAEIERDQAPRAAASCAATRRSARALRSRETDDGDRTHGEATKRHRRGCAAWERSVRAATMADFILASGAPCGSRDSFLSSQHSRSRLRARRAGAGQRRAQSQPQGRGHPADPSFAGGEGRALHRVPPAHALVVAPGEARAGGRDARNQHHAALRRALAARRAGVASPTTPSRCASAHGGRRSPTRSCSRATPAATSRRSSTGSTPARRSRCS